MNINIAYLYYDLMNLYGENGNIKALVYSLKTQNIDVNVDYLSKDDEINFDKYDVIYMSSGMENNELIVLDDILKYKKELNDFIEKEKFVFATGNSFELFGKKIGEKEALGIFNYKAEYIDKRIVGDYIKDTKLEKILAFQNRGSKIIDNDNPLFDEEVGYNYKNFYGTYLIGPILVRNPKLNEYITKKIIMYKDHNFKFNKFDFKLDEKAKESYFNTYY